MILTWQGWYVAWYEPANEVLVQNLCITANQE